MDLGSNTLRLLVARVEDGRWQALDRGLATPRLGAGLEPGGRLDPGARRAARDHAREFTRRARELGAQRVVLGATQACRVAADGAEFVARLGRELGLDRARVLTGEQEARLSRLGVLSRLRGPVAGAWLADIGGGSTELVELAGEGGQETSLPLGTVTLTRRYLAGDPPRDHELAALERAVQEGLAPWAGRPVRRLVATAGTAATLGTLLLGHRRYRPDELDNLVVGRDQLEAQFRRLAGLDLAGRRRLLVLEPRRAEIILAGLAILRGLVRLWRLEQFTVMDAGLLEGILLDEVNEQARGE